MNTQQRLKQIKGLVQQAQAMHKPVFIGADELQIFIESLDAVERERDELRKTLAATQDGAAEAINHSLQLQSEIERRDAEAGEPVAERIAFGPRGDTYEIWLGANRYHYRTDGTASLMKEGNNHAYPCRVTSKAVKFALAAIASQQESISQLKISAAQPAVLPPGWKLVPIEPTEDMVISGFESKPREGFSDPDDWGAFEAMSGCEQAAHKARLCYAAMLAAAPAPGGDDVKQG